MTQVKTKSQATVDAYGLLQANPGKSFTIKAVAEALGLTSAQVTGGLVSLAKKGIVTKEEVQVDGKPYKAYTYAEEVEFVFEDTKNISDKAVQVLTFLQNNDSETGFTASDIAEDMKVVPIAVNGVVNGLVKRGLAGRSELVVEAPDGTSKSIKVVNLTICKLQVSFI